MKFFGAGLSQFIDSARLSGFDPCCKSLNPEWIQQMLSGIINLTAEDVSNRFIRMPQRADRTTIFFDVCRLGVPPIFSIANRENSSASDGHMKRFSFPEFARHCIERS